MLLGILIMHAHDGWYAYKNGVGNLYKNKNTTNVMNAYYSDPDEILKLAADPEKYGAQWGYHTG